MSTANAHAPISLQAAPLAAAYRAYPPTAWVPSHAVDVLAAAVADAQIGLYFPERICRDDADRAAYAAHYETAARAELFRLYAAQPS